MNPEIIVQFDGNEKVSWYKGRNGIGIARGVCLNWFRGRLTIQPINQRGVTTACYIEIPMSMQEYDKLAETIKEMRKDDESEDTTN
jgi:hypothetical protein